MTNAVADTFETNAFRKNLTSWFAIHKRELPWREESTPYRVWVSEIMLQQTRVDTVIPYYEQFMRTFPTMTDLAEADEDTLLKTWEGLGYYSRVRNLQSAVREVVEEYGGEVPDSREAVESLKGVGPYTAGAILSIAYGKPEPAVDGNVMRVLSRVLLISDDISKQKTRKQFEQALYEMIDPRDPSSFNQGLMELGALVCTPTSPGCLLCPVREQCRAYEQGVQEELPVKSKKKKAKEKELASFLLRSKEGKVLIEKRPSTGLLAGLWQFPQVEVADPSNEVERKQLLKDTYGPQTSLESSNADITHVFSHLVWHIQLYYGRVKDQDLHKHVHLRWVDVHELEAYAFPVFQQKLINQCYEEGLL
ncbi:A/G-specific adenine glycosylase [Shouchella shacheensis]|uniref:A/G-specific adenine glycosylase n=1 Tax=Shouchella shacheensis TaxID=1649580 RepID=UPI0007400B82|nr:A/G-specific adenine glycosylase [Shouchella shacheensis]